MFRIRSMFRIGPPTGTGLSVCSGVKMYEKIRSKRSPNNSGGLRHSNPLVQTTNALFLYRNLRKVDFRPHLGPFPVGIWGREAPESENLSIFTDFVLVRSPCLLGRSRPSIHRWKALVVKEKKKERKEGERERVWVIFHHQKHGAARCSRGQNWCRKIHGINKGRIH